ncbi:hypothetical protein M409DRAFT_23338 [Zasmidium cellare ATCC 36951]|uniref:Uncharacterized protein n=1 Tax=Zasmidium cellare ATCC 36951 TaxID=1080233 RepID=A0A6A6CIY7_ZASCE|nr:uncharacterized protein M409DRAFT_23338 [Zasmidium cellare ATCC 36951]KAF2166148.1 hypothetical protein M409DRAFT_23338 [Zasmidium cellare ATCC 36951]
MLATTLLTLPLVLSTALANAPIPAPSGPNNNIPTPATNAADAVATLSFTIEGLRYWMILNSVVQPGPTGIENILLSALNLAYDGVVQGPQEVALDTQCSSQQTVGGVGITMVAGFNFAHFDSADWHDILEFFCGLVSNQYNFPSTLVGTVTNPAVGSIAYATLGRSAQNRGPMRRGRKRQSGSATCSGNFLS